MKWASCCIPSYRINVNMFAAVSAVLVTIYFWWENIKGMHESSGKALHP